MAAENRTLSATDETNVASVDALGKDVPVLWERANPLWKRWAMDPNAKEGIALAERGVRQKVHKEIEGGDAYRIRTDLTQSATAGRAVQSTQFARAYTQTLMPAYWEPKLFQSWMNVGFQDRLEIQGGPAANYDFVAGKIKNAVMSLSRILGENIYATGYTTAIGSVNTPVLTLQGLMLACNNTNIVMFSAADGYYAGINRITAANADWCGNNTTITAPLQPSDIQSMYMKAQDGADAPTLMICGATVYGILWNFYEAKQRILGNDDPTLGKNAPLSFDGCSVMLDKTLDGQNLASATAAPFLVSATGTTLAEIPELTSQALYFLNENYINLVTWRGGAAKGGSPVIMGKLDSTTDLGIIGRAAWLGCLAVEQPKRQGILNSITG